jgi:peptidoglycan/LPS O-acetylase OafA/YrhL
VRHVLPADLAGTVGGNRIRAWSDGMHNAVGLSHSIEYRREIDGLRAVAVLPVVFFHAGFPIFGGGFVGVDVFFVISGYLITSIIVTEKAAGTFRLAQFYERRARRILPALFVVVFACMPFAWFWLLPNDLGAFAKSLIAVVFFSSNFLFSLESGYFDGVGDLKPLLHTWSLAVEEQYYVLFPLLILMAWPLGKRRLFVILSALAVISLLVAQWSSRLHPDPTFFLLHTRCWELAIGALTALYLFRREPSRIGALGSQLAAGAGLVLIATAVVTFRTSIPFPSFYTLLPTVGAALIILFATPQTFVGLLLGWKPLVAIGLISYSTYLWHQPILAFARYRYLGELHSLALLSLCLLAVLLGHLTWRFVELPFRRKGALTVGQTKTLGVSASLLALSAGSIALLNNGFPSRIPDRLEWHDLGERIKTVGPVCKRRDSEVFSGVNNCYFGDPNSTKLIALYGDSHAEAIWYQLDTEFRKNGIKGIYLRARGCEPVPRVTLATRANRAPNCLKSYENLLDLVKTQTDGVVISVRWTFRLHPIEGFIDAPTFDNEEGGREMGTHREYFALGSDGRLSKAASVKRSAVEHLLESMTATGKRIFLVYPVPELGWDVARTKFFYPDRDLSTSFDLYKTRNRFILKVFDEYAAPNIVKIRTADLFCNGQTGRCIGQSGSVPLYLDDDHLSDAGAKLIVDRVIDGIRQR